MKQLKDFAELSEKYDFEIERILKVIKKQGASRVLLQFPDGLKQYAIVIEEELEKLAPKTEFFIWYGSCYGACDLPYVSDNDFDLIVQFGHSAWKFKKNDY